MENISKYKINLMKKEIMFVTLTMFTLDFIKSTVYDKNLLKVNRQENRTQKYKHKSFFRLIQSDGAIGFSSTLLNGTSELHLFMSQ